MKKLVPTLDNFMKNIWDTKNPAVDVATAYACQLVEKKKTKNYYLSL